MENEKKPGVLARLRSALFNRAATVERNAPAADRIPWTRRTIAGEHVNEDNMLTVSAAWASVRYISQSVAIGPWHVMQIVPGGGVVASAHPVERLLYWRPSAEYSSRDFRAQLTSWALRWGNGYAEIEPDQTGRPFALHPIHPDRVKVCRSTEDGFDSYGETIADGDLYYEVDGNLSSTVYLSQKRMFHIRGMGEGPVGMSVAHYAAQSIGWAKAASLFGAAFFGNGANVSLVVKNKIAMSRESLAAQKAEFDSLYKGSRNAHKTAHVDADTDVTPITTTFADSQFVELNKFLISDVARWFGVPLHKIGDLDRATNNNIEHQAIEAVQDCILPWVLRFEEEADYKLFGQNRKGYYTKINLDGLLRGDQKARADALKVARDAGVISTDEWRERIDMNPIGAAKGGDLLLVQAAQIPLDRVGENFAAQLQQAQKPPTPPAKAEIDDDNDAIWARLADAGIARPDV